jgi:hypothetical protein
MMGKDKIAKPFLSTPRMYNSGSRVNALFIPYLGITR